MKGVVTLDPATTAPEDQIYPQPVQNPVRSSSDFKGVNGAVVNGMSQTGTNAPQPGGTQYYRIQVRPTGYSSSSSCRVRNASLLISEII